MLNNLEFDHADIYPDLGAIERQFHHLVRTVPGSGRIIVNARDANLDRVLEQGCWSGLERFARESTRRARRPRRCGARSSRRGATARNSTVRSISTSAARCAGR